MPLYGVGTLDAVAWALPIGEQASEGALLGVVGDAMRGEVYPALFRFEGGEPVRLGPDRVARPHEAALEWASLDEPLFLAGNGLAKHGRDFVDALGQRALVLPAENWTVSGKGLLRSYERALRTREQGTGDVGALLPIYTRLSDAEQAEQERHGRATGGMPESGVHGPSESPPAAPSPGATSAGETRGGGCPDASS